eukprot:TRINITY_DN2350_c0_g1_i1.p1 TRINITY_DN2350_c0_g1~~TRINITY_DN2350_c0_g1_i1.p1  ORF type:complete len:1011 (+),score=311.79 TRINITY_DN2350_c0_g1_i1:43-3075(+)
MNDKYKGVIYGDIDVEEKEKILNHIWASSNNSLYHVSLFTSWLTLIEKMDNSNISKEQYIRKKFLDLKSKDGGDYIKRIERALNPKELSDQDIKNLLALENSIYSCLYDEVFESYLKNNKKTINTQTVPMSSPKIVIEEINKQNNAQKQEKRNFALKELIFSEKKYLDLLIQVRDLYSVPMRNNKMFIDSKFVSDLLDLIDNLIETHTTFNSSINGEYEKNGLDSLFAPFFTLLTTKVDKYKAYSLLWQKALDSIDLQIKESKKHSDFINTKCGNETIKGKLGFQNLTIQPIQRTMRYAMLLKAIYKVTNKEHQDYYPLKMVIAKMTNFSVEIENYQKFERIKELSNAFKLGDLSQFSDEIDDVCRREHCWKNEKLAQSEVCIKCHEKIKETALKCSECLFYIHTKSPCTNDVKPNCVGFKKPGKLENGRRFFIRDGKASYKLIDLSKKEDKEWSPFQNNSHNILSNVSLYLFSDSIAIASEGVHSHIKDLKLITFLKWHSEATNIWVTCKDFQSHKNDIQSIKGEESSNNNKNDNKHDNKHDKFDKNLTLHSSSLPKNDQMFYLYLTDSFFHFKRHLICFSKSSMKDSWKDEINDSIQKWKDFGRFRHVTKEKPKFNINKLLQANYTVKCVSDFLYKSIDEKKKKVQTDIYVLVMIGDNLPPTQILKSYEEFVELNDQLHNVYIHSKKIAEPPKIKTSFYKANKEKMKRNEKVTEIIQSITRLPGVLNLKNFQDFLTSTYDFSEVIEGDILKIDSHKCDKACAKFRQTIDMDGLLSKHLQEQQQSNPSTDTNPQPEDEGIKENANDNEKDTNSEIGSTDSRSSEATFNIQLANNFVHKKDPSRSLSSPNLKKLFLNKKHDMNTMAKRTKTEPMEDFDLVKSEDKLSRGSSDIIDTGDLLADVKKKMALEMIKEEDEDEDSNQERKPTTTTSRLSCANLNKSPILFSKQNLNSKSAIVKQVWEAKTEFELSVTVGEKLDVFHKVNDDWFLVKKGDTFGYLPVLILDVQGN